MCTCISYLSKYHYFGRNLDLEYSYKESVTITPRGFPFRFKYISDLKQNYAIIGIATVENGYPLYYDAVNEHGLCAAGLNFPGNAVYQSVKIGFDNIASYEVIPWVLRQCKNLTEAKELLKHLRVTDDAFSDKFQATPLHWMLSDVTGSVVLEPMSSGVKVYENAVGVLTNNPPFAFHMHNLCQYMNLTREAPDNRMADSISLMPFSRGLGAFGLPGDLSSASRFIRASFVKFNSVDDGTESSAVNQFFHILQSVAQQRGCVRVGDSFEKTVYSSCCNAQKSIYYYTTYDNSRIQAVNLCNTKIAGDKLEIYPLSWSPDIKIIK